VGTANPTATLKPSFFDYVQASEERLAPHMKSGIPDYAYREDYQIRKQIKKLPGFFPFIKFLTSQVVPLMKQQQNLTSLKVGPSQFPDVYAKAQRCARILGIGTPTVFIEPDLSTVNAYTFATEDDDPMIVITSAALERLSGDELLAVIGHECGHIHNNHTIHTLAAQLLIDGIGTLPPVNKAMLALATPLKFMFLSWSRAAEVTSDRAGIICSNSLESCQTLEAKFLYGSAVGRDEIDLESIYAQYDTLRRTPVRLVEIEHTHPIPTRRLLANREFFRSEILHSWRPDLVSAGHHLLDKKTLDKRTQALVGVAKSGKREDEEV
jgi:Zn-dependent protease with chaperone function